MRRLRTQRRGRSTVSIVPGRPAYAGVPRRAADVRPDVHAIVLNQGVQLLFEPVNSTLRHSIASVYGVPRILRSATSGLDVSATDPGGVSPVVAGFLLVLSIPRMASIVTFALKQALLAVVLGGHASCSAWR
jgi:hypothetical protein